MISFALKNCLHLLPLIVDFCEKWVAFAIWESNFLSRFTKDQKKNLPASTGVVLTTASSIVSSCNFSWRLSIASLFSSISDFFDSRLSSRQDRSSVSSSILASLPAFNWLSSSSFAFNSFSINWRFSFSSSIFRENESEILGAGFSFSFLSSSSHFLWHSSSWWERSSFLVSSWILSASSSLLYSLRCSILSALFFASSFSSCLCTEWMLSYSIWRSFWEETSIFVCWVCWWSFCLHSSFSFFNLRYESASFS